MPIRCSCTNRRRAFTVTDLLVILFLICFWIAVIFAGGALTKARAAANRIKCAENLKQIGLGLALYANENKGNIPRTIYHPGAPLNQYTGVDCKDPFGKEGAPKSNDVTAGLFLLIRTQGIAETTFICPATNADPEKFGNGKTSLDYGNFSSQETLGYSLLNAYPDPNAVSNGYRMYATPDRDWVMAADMNPGVCGDYDVTPKTGPKNENAPTELIRKANSMNHRGDGQNVLFCDGRVEFRSTPFCGAKHDNIYTASGSGDGTKTTSETISASPKWTFDTILLPAASAKR